MDACGCEWECVCVLCLETGDIILHLKIKVVCHVKKKKKRFLQVYFFIDPKSGTDWHCFVRAPTCIVCSGGNLRNVSLWVVSDRLL